MTLQDRAVGTFSTSDLVTILHFTSWKLQLLPKSEIASRLMLLSLARATVTGCPFLVC